MTDAYAQYLQALIDNANMRHALQVSEDNPILAYIQGLTHALELYKLHLKGVDFTVDESKIFKGFTDND